MSCEQYFAQYLMPPIDATIPRDLTREILEDFVEYIDANDDRQETAELAQFAFLEDRKERQKECQANLRLERRIKKQHSEVRVCEYCNESFVVVVGKQARPQKWHTPKCRMGILRAAQGCSTNPSTE